MKVTLRQSQIKSCNHCKMPIAFAQNRFGKWFAVDVQQQEGVNFYFAHTGNHNNWTKAHSCQHWMRIEAQLAESASRQTAEAEAKAQAERKQANDRAMLDRFLELTDSGMPQKEAFAIANSEYPTL